MITNGEIELPQYSDSVICGRFNIDKNEGIRIKGKESSQLVKVAEYARIKSIRVDRTTGYEFFELEYLRVSTKSIESQWISSDQLTSQRSEQLIQYGLDITMTNKRQVTEALLASRAHAQVENVFNQFGWGEPATSRFSSMPMQSQKEVTLCQKVQS